MAARIKRVVDTPMVAHLWAHQSQDEARNACRNCFYDGDTIYSYGHHFPIARHVENRRGERAVLLTTATYSSTTAGHIYCVQRACQHLTVFKVPHPRNDGPAARREDFEDYRKRLFALMQKYIKARTNKPYILRSIGELVHEANAFAKFFGLRTRINVPPAAEAMAAECDRIVKAEDARKRKAASAAERKRQTLLDEWTDGADVYARFGGLPVRLRIKGDEVQTSLGASVETKDAIRVFRILKRLRKKAQAYKRNGETISVGPFALDSMDTDGTVRVGCHEIAWSEIERIAALAGVA